ncbi:MAG: methyltransferase dimerization domain-containing protein, partial [Burkholderiaceae bacterium]
MTARALAAADLWFNWRNSLLASDRFRRLASGFLPTRWIARRRAGALFDLVAGFVYSQVLLACVRLKLFDILAEGPQTPETLAHRTSLQPEAMERLLSAAVALRLVQRRSGQRYGLGDLGAAMVGNTAVAAMVDHHAALYADLADPVALLR